MILADAALPFRHREPRLERARPWLSWLFDAYAVIDADIAALISRETALACHKGCTACCLAWNVPLTVPEALGLRLFLREKAGPDLRGRIERSFAANADCAFLQEGACAAYSFRPIACRRYLVRNAPCAPGEAATETRPQDVIHPDRAALRTALLHTLPYYRRAGLIQKPAPAFEDFVPFMLMLSSLDVTEAPAAAPSP